jgi:hypothetical protein
MYDRIDVAAAQAPSASLGSYLVARVVCAAPRETDHVRAIDFS